MPELIVGSDRGHRTMTRAPSSARRRCTCGCGTRATHLGRGDGVVLMVGCEWLVRRWVREGAKALYRT